MAEKGGEGGEERRGVRGKGGIGEGRRRGGGGGGKGGGGGGGGGGDKGNGLGGQRSGSLASKSVYCNTGCVRVDNLINWMFVLRDHNPEPKV